MNIEAYLQKEPNLDEDTVDRLPLFPAFVEVREATFRILPDPPGTLLDIGSAGGWAVKRLSELGYDVTALTLFEEEASVLRDHGLDTVVCDMHDLPAAWTGRFDIVRSSHSFEHCYAPHIALSEWSRVLRPGGTLQISMPAADGYCRAGPFEKWPIRMGSMDAHLFCASVETVIEMIRHPRVRLVFDHYQEDPVYEFGMLQYGHRTWMAHKRAEDDGGDWFRSHEWWQKYRLDMETGKCDAY